MKKKRDLTWIVCPADQILQKPFNPFISALNIFFDQASNENRQLNLEKFEESIKSDPSNAEYHMNAGAMYAKLSEAAKGEEKTANKVRQAAIDKGTNAELNTYGYQLLTSGNPKGAVEIFEANSKKNPDDPNVWDSLGEGYMWAGEKEKAIKALKKSLSRFRKTTN